MPTNGTLRRVLYTLVSMTHSQVPRAPSLQRTQGRTRRCVDAAPPGQRETCSNDLLRNSALLTTAVVGNHPLPASPTAFHSVGEESERSEQGWGPNHQRHPEKSVVRNPSCGAESSQRSGRGSERSEQGWVVPTNGTLRRVLYALASMTHSQVPRASSLQRTQGRTRRCVDAAPPGQRETCSNNLSRISALSRLPLLGTTLPRPLPKGGAHPLAACWEPSTPDPNQVHSSTVAHDGWPVYFPALEGGVAERQRGRGGG